MNIDIKKVFFTVLFVIFFKPIFLFPFTNYSKQFIMKSDKSIEVNVDIKPSLKGIRKRISYNNLIVNLSYPEYVTISDLPSNSDYLLEYGLPSVDKVMKGYSYKIPCIYVGGSFTILSGVMLVTTGVVVCALAEGDIGLIGSGLAVLGVGYFPIRAGYKLMNFNNLNDDKFYYYLNENIYCKITDYNTGKYYYKSKEIRIKEKSKEKFVNELRKQCYTLLDEKLKEMRDEKEEPIIDFNRKYSKNVRATNMVVPLVLKDDVELSSVSLSCSESNFNEYRNIGGYNQKVEEFIVPLISGENNIDFSVEDWCGKKTSERINIFVLKDIENTTVTFGPQTGSDIVIPDDHVIKTEKLSAATNLYELQADTNNVLDIGDKKNIAIMDLDPIGVSKNDILALGKRVSAEIFKTGNFVLLERGKMNEILNEQGFQMSGCTSEECLIEAGKLLNVEMIIGGSISKIGQIYSIDLRIIDVETGQIMAISTQDIKGTIEDVFTVGIHRSVSKLIR